MNTKEAIERIKTRFGKWALDDEDMKAIQTLIPELAESEDERIRKYLIKRVVEFYGEDSTTPEGFLVKDIVAYLEKQKEQKSVEWSEEDKGLLERAISIIGWAGSCTDKYKIINPDGAAELQKFLKSLRPQPKQEWSEKDEDMLSSIIATCQLAAQDRDSSPARHLFERQERFLKSFRSCTKSSDNWKPVK